MSKRLGIIGGMGPQASQLLYKMITEMTDAEYDQDHIEMIIFSDTSMPDRTAAILKGDYDKIRNRLLADALMLEQCGADLIAIPCNTSHFFIDMIKDELNIPIIHMVQETVDIVGKSSKGEKVAVLATDGTIKTELYQSRLAKLGIEPFVPNDEMQELVMYQIYDRIKSGKPCHEEKWLLLENYLKEKQCKRVILACTELSIIKKELGLGDFYIDPMIVLAERAIELSDKKIRQVSASLSLC